MEELFLSSTSFREQCYRVLRHERDPLVPFEMIARLFSGVSLTMDDDRVIRSNVMPHTVRHLLEPVIPEEMLGLAREDEEEPNVQEYSLRMSGRLVKMERLRRLSPVLGS
jgi:hypothetical protein